jgi:hypothetical protein
MRYLFVVSWVLLSPLTSAVAQVSIGIGLPNVSIGINLPVYPQLVVVPGYPVYYAPGVDSNYFFYDGMYWVYQDDNWYASSWYNGPWALVSPEAVPVYILRVPVRYYRRPPAYFGDWRRDAPPRWGEHWGHDWERRHGGWDRWNRGAAPPPAPLPVYQRQYSGNRYPQAEQQRQLHGQYYRYRPRDASVQQAYQAHGLQRGPPPSQRGDRGQPRPGEPQQRGMMAPRQQPQRAPGVEEGRQGRGGMMAPRQQPPPRNEERQGRGGAPEPKGPPGQPKGDERGPEHNR